MTRFQVDHSGKRFGLWVVLTKAPNRTGRRTAWLCRCECGTEKSVASCHLVSGASTNCGCIRPERARTNKTKPGMSGTNEYEIWRRMKARCSNKNLDDFRLYGGKGIIVCEAWKNSFDAFIRDMGKRPSIGHSIDRINSGGNYEPKNCRWATPKEQARNTSRNRFHIVKGERMTITEAIERYGEGQNPGTVKWRISEGQSAEHALRLK